MHFDTDELFLKELDIKIALDTSESSCHYATYLCESEVDKPKFPDSWGLAVESAKVFEDELAQDVLTSFQ